MVGSILTRSTGDEPKSRREDGRKENPGEHATRQRSVLVEGPLAPTGGPRSGAVVIRRNHPEVAGHGGSPIRRGAQGGGRLRQPADGLRIRFDS